MKTSTLLFWTAIVAVPLIVCVPPLALYNLGSQVLLSLALVRVAAAELSLALPSSEAPWLAASKRLLVSAQALPSAELSILHLCLQPSLVLPVEVVA